MILAVNESAHAQSLFFDFGNTATPTAGNYNNLSYAIAGTTPGSPVTISLNNAIDSTGAATTISLSTVISSTSWAGMNTSGTTSPSGAASIFASTATSDFFYASFHAPVISLTGLDGSGNTSYSFTFFGSRTGVSDDREANYNVVGSNTGSVLLDAANNTSNVGIVSGITPDSFGNLVINVSAGPDNNDGSGLFISMPWK